MCEIYLYAFKNIISDRDTNFDDCKLLFEYGADINLCHNLINNLFGLTDTFYQKNGMDQIINLFIEYGLDIRKVIDLTEES
jgi:hypothetical protein